MCVFILIFCSHCFRFRVVHIKFVSDLFTKTQTYTISFDRVVRLMEIRYSRVMNTNIETHARSEKLTRLTEWKSKEELNVLFHLTEIYSTRAESVISVCSLLLLSLLLASASERKMEAERERPRGRKREKHNNVTRWRVRLCVCVCARGCTACNTMPAASTCIRWVYSYSRP